MVTHFKKATMRNFRLDTDDIWSNCCIFLQGNRVSQYYGKRIGALLIHRHETDGYLRKTFDIRFAFTL